MSTYLDIETDRWTPDEDEPERLEYLRILVKNNAVGFEHEHTDRDGKRRVDCDAGASFDLRFLDQVIDALTRIRNDRPLPPNGDGTKEGA